MATTILPSVPKTRSVTNTMLDYSDEELEAQNIRKRSHSPSKLGAQPEQEEYFHGGGNQLPPVDFTNKTQSIFKEYKERSSKFITPNPPLTNAFFISEFIPSKPLKQKFGLNFRGCNAVEDQSGKFPLDNNEDHVDSFFKSMRMLVFLAQFFAVFPVSGVRGSNYKSLSFKWIHYKTVYWGLALLGTIFCFICEALRGLEEGAFEAASGIMYFGCGILSSFLMLNLSRNWRNLNEEFARVEYKLKKYGYPKKIGLKFKLFTILCLLVGLVEHILAKLRNFKIVAQCFQRNFEFYTLAKSYFLMEYVEVFSLLSYTLWKGILVFCAQFLVTANWNFKDLFLCLISWTISKRFKQINELLDKVHGQDKPTSFWKEIREDYNSISILTKRVDTYIRSLMFLSIGNNLFFICIQLFYSLKKKVDSFRLIYFFWSFGFLVLRTASVAFSAAGINDESKEPKSILYSVPQKNYTAEVRRFLTQLTTNEVALTGSGFFSVTRSLILTITGSVITYEIVLVQFGTKDVYDILPVNGTKCLKD